MGLLDFGESQEFGQYLVMDYVDGVTLRSLILPGIQAAAQQKIGSGAQAYGVLQEEPGTQVTCL